MATHTITREQWARGGKRRRYTGRRVTRTARQHPTVDIMAAAPVTSAATSSVDDWHAIMAAARSAVIAND